MKEQADYEKVIDYIENEITTQHLKLGDRLPAEREISSALGVSRGSVRIGLNVLEALGVIDNKHGSGNYITDHFDRKLVQVMTMMYTLDDMPDQDILAFRYAAEQQAAILAIQNITDDQKKLLKNYLQIMETSKNEEERSHCDAMIHQTIVEASHNRLITANYLALNRIMERQVRQARERVSSNSREAAERFQQTHRDLVYGICIGDIEKTRQALAVHYDFLM